MTIIPKITDMSDNGLAMRSDDIKTCTNLIKRTMSKLPEIFDKDGKALHIGAVITPFWLWLVREAKIEVIDAENFIEVHGFTKEGDNMIPVISFDELLELYISQNEL